jgi:hypothetical protein
LAAARGRTRWSFPPFGCGELSTDKIETRSVRDAELICIGNTNDTTENSMSKFKIEKGISRVTRVKLQATIEESIAADLVLMGEWSNNDKNYIVSELLRFALSQDSEFQAYKDSVGTSRPEPRSSGTPPSMHSRAVSASKAEPSTTESASGPRI